jgi:hypothetical protein
VTPFAYSPNELEDISIFPLTRVRLKKSDEIYITRDINLDDKYDPRINSNINPKGGVYISLLSLQRVIDKYGFETKLGSIEDNLRNEDLDLFIMNCNGASESRSVIWFKEGTQNRIYQESEGCYIAEFKENDDPNKVGTAMAYHIIGIF